MASDVDIINRAATKLGTDRITSRSDEGKFPEAADACFDQLRDAEMRKNTWRFTVTRVELSALATEPTFGFLREFQLPAD